MKLRIVIVLSIISVLGTVSSIVFAFLAYKRNAKTDNKQEGKNEGVLISDVGYIKSSIDRIEKNMDKLEDRYNQLSMQLSKTEESVAQAHKRITEHINYLMSRVFIFVRICLTLSNEFIWIIWTRMLKLKCKNC